MQTPQMVFICLDNWQLPTTIEIILSCPQRHTSTSMDAGISSICSFLYTTNSTIHLMQPFIPSPHQQHDHYSIAYHCFMQKWLITLECICRSPCYQKSSTPMAHICCFTSLNLMLDNHSPHSIGHVKYAHHVKCGTSGKQQFINSMQKQALAHYNRL